MTVHLRGVTQHYGRTPALDDIDLHVAPGEFVALVGPSGAGKTTVLRVIAGLEGRYEGALHIAGADMRNVPARRRNIGFVFQNYALFRNMTVADNVAFGLRVQRLMPAAQIHARVAELLDLVQIPQLARRYPQQLSGGQQQRVALARALATAPQLMLMDEPFGALDPLVRKEIRTWLRALHTRLGLTSLFITHDQGEAIELADRVAIMQAGRILQFDTPAELETNPAVPFVFEFLGPTIRLQGVVEGGSFHTDSLPVSPFPVAVPAGQAVALARPHELDLLPDGGDAIITAARRAGPLMHYDVQSRGRILELHSTASPLQVGTACSLRLTNAKIFPTEKATVPVPELAFA